MELARSVPRAAPERARYAPSMSTVAMEIPEESLVALKLDARGAATELRLVAAVKLYELGRLSSGAAAALAGFPRVAFLAKLAELGSLSFQETETELAEDLARA
jgi:predicted HTH domain antitoxin